MLKVPSRFNAVHSIIDTVTAGRIQFTVKDRGQGGRIDIEFNLCLYGQQNVAILKDGERFDVTNPAYHRYWDILGEEWIGRLVRGSPLPNENRVITGLVKAVLLMDGGRHRLLVAELNTDQTPTAWHLLSPQFAEVIHEPFAAKKPLAILQDQTKLISSITSEAMNRERG